MPTTPTGQQQAALTPEQVSQLVGIERIRFDRLMRATARYNDARNEIEGDYREQLEVFWKTVNAQQPANADTRAQEAAHDDLATGYARYEFSRRAAAGDDSHACAAGERDGGRVGAAGGT